MELNHEAVSTGGLNDEPQQDHHLLPPRYPVLGVSPLLSGSSPLPSPVLHLMSVTSTPANSPVRHQGCRYCRKIKPLSEFMKPGAANAFKACNSCRQSRTAAFRGWLAKRKADLQSEVKAQSFLYQTPIQGDSQAQNEGCAQVPLTPFTMMNQSGLVIPGLLQQPSVTPCLPDRSPETTEVHEQNVACTQPLAISDDKDSDGEATAPLSASSFFRCLHCDVTRSARLEYSGFCVYCFEHEQKYCVAGQHEEDRPCFVGADGVEYEDCNGCRGAY